MLVAMVADAAMPSGFPSSYHYMHIQAWPDVVRSRLNHAWGANYILPMRQLACMLLYCACLHSNINGQISILALVAKTQGTQKMGEDSTLHIPDIILHAPCVVHASLQGISLQIYHSMHVTSTHAVHKVSFVYAGRLLSPAP